MTPKKVLEVITIYENRLRELGIKETKYNHSITVPQERAPILGHCLGMFEEMREFVSRGKMRKVFRWLGFVQGCLWSMGVYDIEELRNHNRPAAGEEED
jgi:hypothetical protein